MLDVEDPRTVWVGLPLEMAAAILDCHLSPQGYKVQTYHIDPSKLDKYTTKKLIRDAVLDPKARVMINYDRGYIGQGTCMTSPQEGVSKNVCIGSILYTILMCSLLPLRRSGTWSLLSHRCLQLQKGCFLDHGCRQVQISSCLGTISQSL